MALEKTYVDLERRHAGEPRRVGLVGRSVVVGEQPRERRLLELREGRRPPSHGKSRVSRRDPGGQRRVGPPPRTDELPNLSQCNYYSAEVVSTCNCIKTAEINF